MGATADRGGRGGVGPGAPRSGLARRRSVPDSNRWPPRSGFRSLPSTPCPAPSRRHRPGARALPGRRGTDPSRRPGWRPDLRFGNAGRCRVRARDRARAASRQTRRERRHARRPAAAAGRPGWRSGSHCAASPALPSTSRTGCARTWNTCWRRAAPVRAWTRRLVPPLARRWSKSPVTAVARDACAFRPATTTSCCSPCAPERVDRLRVPGRSPKSDHRDRRHRIRSRACASSDDSGTADDTGAAGLPALRTSR